MNQSLKSVTITLAGASLVLSASVALGDEPATEGPERVPARAGDFALKIEPGVALPLSPPQSQLFEVGGSQTVKALWTLNPYFDLGPSVTFLSLPAEAEQREAGTAWSFGGSLRLKRPHHAPDNDAWFAASPWVDLDALYVRTGDLNRAGFAAAVGVSLPIGASRAFWIGPFARYFQIVQGTPSGFDNRDGRFLSLGVSLEMGSSVARKLHTPPPVAAAPQTVLAPAPAACPDRDNDGIPDGVDRCPDLAGPMDAWGCRKYEKLVVKPDKLELKERLYFAWDQAVIQEASYPVLDEVVLALNDNKGFRVQVEGHASSEGVEAHNQTLSEQRAAAVVDYLVAHGVAKDRLVAKGFSSSVPTDTNQTVSGRERNRRVEFVVNFLILENGSK